jgi:hypothetical protein
MQSKVTKAEQAWKRKPGQAKQNKQAKQPGNCEDTWCNVRSRGSKQNATQCEAKQSKASQANKASKRSEGSQASKAKKATKAKQTKQGKESRTSKDK